MPEGESTTTTAATTAGQTSASGTTTEVIEGAEHLGDKGKQALDRMKAERDAAIAAAKAAGGDAAAAERIKAERAELASTKAAFAALEAKVAGKEAEHAAQVAAQKVKDEALGAANTRILKAEVRAAATGKLSDPADALLYLDLTKFEVGEDGEVDAKALGAALDELVKNKPYLAAQGKRFQGNGDGGPRNESDKSIDDQIAEATKSGNHILAIALKQKRSADLAASK
jgi:hypothetical protein